MTAEEAMDRAQLIVTSCCRCQNPGVPLDEAIAAELIRVQIEGLEYAYLNADLVPIGARLIECRAALAELEGRDA